MSTTTCTGPLRTGTQREGATPNVGPVILSQSYDSGDMTGDVIGDYDAVAARLPAGAQIVDIIVDQVVVSGTGTTTVSVGNASGGAQLMAAVNSSAGGRFSGVATAATQLAWQTAATADTVVYVRAAVAVGTLTTGRFILTVNYVQK